MTVCQTSDYHQNSGSGFSISCVAAPACTSARKRIAGVLSRPSYGPLWGPMATAPAEYGNWNSVTNSPVGLTKASNASTLLRRPGSYLIIDSTVVRATLARRELPQKGWPDGPSPGPEPRRVQHQDSSVDSLGNPLRFILTGGQQHDITQAEELIAGYHVLADKGYDAQEFRQHILELGMMPVIPPRWQGTRRLSVPGAPSGGRIAIFSRFEKLDTRYLGFLHFTAV